MKSFLLLALLATVINGLQIISPNSTTIWTVGDNFRLDWTLDIGNQTEIPDGINMDLVNIQENNKVIPLVYGIPYFPTPTNEYSFVGSRNILPEDLSSGSMYYVKASYLNAANYTIVSISSLFSIRNPVSPADSASFEFDLSDPYFSGDWNLIKWKYASSIIQSDLVTVSLYFQNDTLAETIVNDYQNTGVCSWFANQRFKNETLYFEISTEFDGTPKAGRSNLFKLN